MKIRQCITAASLVLTALAGAALDHPGITTDTVAPGRFTLLQNSVPVDIMVDGNDEKGISIAASNLADDFGRVSGTKAKVVGATGSNGRLIIAGTEKNPVIKRLMDQGKISRSDLKGKNEKYIITTVASPAEGVDEALVIAGSDRRGVIYGIYEISEQIGVSPWYDWADVPVEHKTNLSIAPGTYTAGEPAVTYRGIFLNDEAPCLTGWVKNTYGTNYGDHRFYALSLIHI